MSSVDTSLSATDDISCPTEGCILKLNLMPNKRNPFNIHHKKPLKTADLAAAIKRKNKVSRGAVEKSKLVREAEKENQTALDKIFEMEDVDASQEKLNQNAMADFAYEDEDEDPSYFGDVNFHPNMRFSSAVIDDPFADLSSSSTWVKGKCSSIFPTNAASLNDRKSGKIIMGQSASRAFQATGQNMVCFNDFSNKNKNQHAEWCHLQADCLMGVSEQKNFIAGRFAANTYMMVIEHAIVKQSYWAQVCTMCVEGSDNVPKSITYCLWKLDPSKYATPPAPDITFPINPLLRSFTKQDMSEVHDRFKKKGFKVNPAWVI